jgi:ATP-dependent DNA helicase RecG
MNRENQNIEWKESWRDEYLKWICGFANAQGGKLYIGKTDNGDIIDLKDAAKLLEDIPNKVRDVLGMIVQVNLLTENDKKYLEIEVEAYPSPISYKGQYHYRSGSTKQELKGAALDKFLLKKHGKRWDGVPVPHLTVKDFAKTAFQYFRKNGIKSKRLDSDILKDSNLELLKKLHLTEGNYLKRAAVLLFHPDPEVYVTGAYVKIGYFRNETDLMYQDEIHGYLFEQVEKTMDLLLTKYLKAYVSYEGLNRKETYPMPETALREALINAIVHKDYSGQTPIQIQVYDDKLILWNPGQLPEDWTIAHLLRNHTSMPYNPLIANAFFRAGLIEAWGRGTLRILSDCKAANAPIPIFQYGFSGLIVEFDLKSSEKASDKVEKTSEKAEKTSEKASDKVEKTSEKTSDKVEKTSEKASDKVEKTSEKILDLIKHKPKITIKELAELTSVSARVVETHLQNLKQNHKIIRRGGRKTGEWEIIG